uniref:MLO-like protein n=1 Tax=Kalanchoe fedtschenkoi TaxID=63787 RepID=A0A7N0T4Y9_KALFE
MEGGESKSFEHTSTWVVAIVCTVIVLLSIVAGRGLHSLGKFLKHRNQDALFEALQKLKEELMILGFISLLLTVTQRVISKICIPGRYVNLMLPCKDHGEDSSTETPASARRLLESETAGAASGHCAAKNMVPMLSVEAVHQLHIFIFVLAVVHVIFCVTTMALGRARIQQWRHWENAIRGSNARKPSAKQNNVHAHHHYEFFKERAAGYWRKYVLFGWMRSFFKQFYGSVTKADYFALRQGFIMVGHFLNLT